MKIIITGASGFVGQNLSQFLKNKKHDIDTLSLRSEWTLDINAHALIHLAGKAHDIENSSDAEDYFKINTELTKKSF